MQGFSTEPFADVCKVYTFKTIMSPFLCRALRTHPILQDVVNSNETETSWKAVTCGRMLRKPFKVLARAKECLRPHLPQEHWTLALAFCFLTSQVSKKQVSCLRTQANNGACTTLTESTGGPVDNMVMRLVAVREGQAVNSKQNTNVAAHPWSKCWFKFLKGIEKYKT